MEIDFSKVVGTMNIRRIDTGQSTNYRGSASAIQSNTTTQYIIIIIIITDIYMARIRKMQQKRQVNCYSLQLLS